MRRGEEQINRLAELAILKVNSPYNAGKGGWQALSTRRLYWLLLVEVWELCLALCLLGLIRHRYRRGGASYAELLDAQINVQQEAADCAAFLAFIVDVVSPPSHWYRP